MRSIGMTPLREDTADIADGVKAGYGYQVIRYKTIVGSFIPLNERELRQVAEALEGVEGAERVHRKIVNAMTAPKGGEE